MPDEPKKIIVDDDWKAEAQREKARLVEQEQAAGPAGPPPAPAFADLLNLVVMQAMAGLGLLAAPGGQPLPPNLEMAKHFIDLLQVLEDKTKGNLSPEEKGLLDQVMYEMRMTFVQIASGAGGGMPDAGSAGPAPRIQPQ